MAPLPKRRHSTQRQGKRRAAIKLKKNTLVKCKNCGSFTIPHRVCVNCGYYGGKEVVKTRFERIKARQEKRKQKEKNNPS